MKIFKPAAEMIRIKDNTAQRHSLTTSGASF